MRSVLLILVRQLLEAATNRAIWVEILAWQELSVCRLGRLSGHLPIMPSDARGPPIFSPMPPIAPSFLKAAPIEPCEASNIDVPCPVIFWPAPTDYNICQYKL